MSFTSSIVAVTAIVAAFVESARPATKEPFVTVTDRLPTAFAGTELSTKLNS